QRSRTVTFHDIDGLITSHFENGLPVTSGSQLEQIHAAIIGNLKPVRPLAPSSFFLLALAVVFLAAVVASSLLLGLSGWGVLRIGQRIAVFSALATGAVLLGLSIVQQMVPGSKHIINPVALPAGLLVSLPL